MILFEGSLQWAHVVVAAIPVETHRRCVHEKLPWQDRIEQAVHAGDRVTDGHGAEGVAVIAIAQGGE